MKKLAIVLLLTTGCGGWGYSARPIDGDGTKSEKPRCFLIERWEDKGWSRHTYQQGEFCKTEQSE